MQAGMSASAYAFLTGNGFTPQGIKAATDQGSVVMDSIGSKSGLDMDDYGTMSGKTN